MKAFFRNQRHGKQAFSLLAIMAVLLMVGALSPAEKAQRSSISWLTPAGQGLLAPACGSSVTTTGCRSSGAIYNFGYSLTGCSGSVVVTLSNGAVMSSPNCGGFLSFTGLPSDTPMTYTVTYTDVNGASHTNTGSFRTVRCL